MRQGVVFFVVTMMVWCGCVSVGFAQEQAPSAPSPAPEPAAAPAPAEKVHSNGSASCGSCHVTANPVKGNSALKTCERPKDMDSDAAKDLPDFLELGQLSSIYVPVMFPHKLHLKMEDMGDGCAICHHHSEPGKTPACRECHEISATGADLKRPSLKGAYHRQCLSCHREWSHEDACALCHAKRVAGEAPAATPDTTDLLGRLHPNVEEPDKRVYPTPGVGENMKVTFYHKEHITVFGKKCVDCHRKENCSRCHDKANGVKHVRANPHDDCKSCHDVENGDCTQCHQEAEAAPFDHLRRTKFSLKEYHGALACTACHKESGRFAGLKAECVSCHAPAFAPKEFKHERTGLKLDMLHEAADCKSCHTQGMGKPASCAECHKDGRKYPDSMPGEKVAGSADATKPAAAPESSPPAAPVPPPASAPAPAAPPAPMEIKMF